VGFRELPTAYVLLNTEIGAERDVLDVVRHIEGVQEAFTVWGLYDIIAQIQADTMDNLAQIITDSFQMSKIHCKLTVVIIEA
jgi:DNA-binding Lrp family transcriptional regulator